MAQIETWLNTDLKKPVRVIPLKGKLFTQDAMGNLIGVHVFDEGEPATLVGSVIGWVMLENQTTVVVTGEKSGNDAYIVLPEAAYAYPGLISITIQLVDESGEEEVKTTVGACTAYVYKSATDVTIDPGEVVPDLATLLAKIEEMTEATEAANEAAEAAEAAAATIAVAELIQDDDYNIILTSGEE